jgi:peptidoglycan/LPS O-acetylase OafA/YrhL
MKHWWPEHVYQSKPYVALGAGAALALLSVVVSIVRGDWGLWALVCAVGFGLVIYGAVILQLRREYRQRSKWARHDSEQDKTPRR